MTQRRRSFLASASGLALGGQQISLGQEEADNQTLGRGRHGLQEDVLDLFADLPDRKAFKIWAPATRNSPGFQVQLNSAQKMFVASAFKSFVLCERLRQLDSPTVEEKIAGHEIALDKSVWSFGSVIFNPPDLSGLVTERTAMEAMMIHSDNTATDMVMKEAGHDNVRRFIASIGLKNTMVPDSTRAFAAYVFGAANYKTITWDELLALPPSLAHPFLNEVQTLASSADDLVSFFSRALQGEFFAHPETLVQFRRILSLGDIAYLVPFQLGANVFGKAGYTDLAGSHARSIAGGVYFPDQWVYFSMVLNWDAPEVEDLKTVKAFFRAVRRSIAMVQQRLGKA